MTVCVNGKEYTYHLYFDLGPFAYFSIAEEDLGDTFEVVLAILDRCRNVFESACIGGVKVRNKWYDRMYDVTVSFAIDENERIEYEKRKAVTP